MDGRCPVLPAALLALGVLAPLGVVACSDDDDDDDGSCAVVADVQEQVDQLRELDIADESVAGLRGALLNLEHRLDDLDDVDDLSDRTEDAIDDLDDRIAGLLGSLGAASEGESDSSSNQAALASGRDQIVSDADSILDDVGGSC